jgi:uncharacterized protein (TIGR02246 family)
MYRPYSSSLADSRPFMDVESQLRGLTQDYVTSFNTGNYDQVAGMFAPDGVLMAPSREAANGRKCVERLLRDLGEEGYSDMRVETIRVENSGDMAMEVGRFSVTIRQANGTLIPERGKYVKVWRRLGAWLILADCWSRNPPVGQ